MKRRDVIKLMGAAPLLKALDADAMKTFMPVDINDSNAHLLVFGSTPGGITCAIRAAREGLKVILVSVSEHLGGMFANGLGTMDTLYNGARSPLYDEFRKSIYDYYRLRYGTNSSQYESSGPGISKTKYEAYVAEELVNKWLKAEPNITIHKGYYPASVKKVNGRLQNVIFRSVDDKQELPISASVFADCSYEGDLLAISGADFIIGRESKKEYGEKYAGVIYSKDQRPVTYENEQEKQDAALGRKLNLYRYSESRTVVIMPESTGEADSNVQGYNLRTILTNDPKNLYLPGKPANYDPEHFKKHYTHKIENPTLSRPNSKSSMAYPEILGTQNKYVEGNWAERRRIIQQYKDEVLGLLYFRQNDPSVPAEVREHWRKLSLANDEFTDNDHIPYDLYVREARRLKSKTVFTEHDALLAPGLRRAPIYTDSITTTEWFLDSHACTESQVRGSKEEGEVMLKTETVPGQVSLEVLFPSRPSNLIVPVCVSASHIGWGAIRLEPVWMSLGEVAAYIAAEACSRKIDPPSINREALIRRLATHRFMLTFFNDVEGRETANWYPPTQYLGTKGFFGSYELLPDQKITQALAKRWSDHLAHWKKTNKWDTNEQAKQNLSIESKPGEPIKASAFALMIEQAMAMPGRSKQWLNNLSIKEDVFLSRGDAARIIFEAIPVK